MMQMEEQSVWEERLNGIARLTVFFLLLLALTPVQIILLRFKKVNPRGLPHFFHRILVRVLGFKVRGHGNLLVAPSVLYVSNHTSYLDIPVLASLIPAAFVAKAEVADWPMFGFLSKLQQTVFVERKASRASEQSNVLQDHLRKGESLILFPEGTSSIGLSALPFKSSLFSIVQGDDFTHPVYVQPVSVCCSGLDGMPLTREMRPFYAWYGDMTLVPHLWNVFKMGRFTVDVVFHPPLNPKDFKDRKELAIACQAQVARGIEQCLTGRGIEAPAANAQIAHSG